MNPLTEMYNHLAVTLKGDPLLLLASAVATFDPYWSEFDDGYNDDEDNPLHIALAVTRGAFPDIYAETVERMRANAPYQELDRLICKAITAKGIPIDDLE
ncbi:hypothetical protein FBQ87_07095, partial [Sphingobacteriales bacterium CHB3]|nr:hypothetical protein [Sphingobacteriales bacterium CHB3]